jgi:hypothetical protein
LCTFIVMRCSQGFLNVRMREEEESELCGFKGNKIITKHNFYGLMGKATEGEGLQSDSTCY